MSHTILIVSNPIARGNVGDVLIQDKLSGLLRAHGNVVSVGARGHRLGDIVRLLQHPAEAVFRQRTSGEQISLVRPPGETVGKPLSAVPRLGAELAYLSLLRAAGVRVISIGRGVSATSRLDWERERLLANVASHYSLRDRESIRQAEAHGIRSACWFPDLTWLGEAPRPQGDRRRIVVALRAREDRSTSVLTTTESAASRAAVQSGIHSVHLVLHDISDVAITTALHARLRRNPNLNVVMDNSVLDVDDIQDTYASAAVVIGNRLHALLLGLQHGSGAVAVLEPYEQKIRRQFFDLQFERFMVDATKPAMAEEAVIRCLSEKALVAEEVERYRHTARDAAFATLARLFPA